MIHHNRKDRIRDILYNLIWDYQMVVNKMKVNGEYKGNYSQALNKAIQEILDLDITEEEIE